MNSASQFSVRRERGKQPASGRTGTVGQAASGASPSEINQRWKHRALGQGTSTHNPGPGAVALPTCPPNQCSHSNPGVEASAQGPAESNPFALETSAPAGQPRSIRASSAIDPKSGVARFSLPHGSEILKFGACKFSGNLTQTYMTERSIVALIGSMRYCERKAFLAGTPVPVWACLGAIFPPSSSDTI